MLNKKYGIALSCEQSYIQPMGQVFLGVVKDISSQGHGVVDHPDGRVFFVRGVWPGDEAEFAIESVKKNYGFANVIKLLKASSLRREVQCEHSGFSKGLCGGCPWMGINYEAQLSFKQKRIEFLVSKNQLTGESTKIQKMRASPHEFGYRNRAQFKTNGEVIGYVSPESKVLAPIKDCIILSEKNRETLKKMISNLPRTDWRAKPPYLWNYIEINEEISAEGIHLNQRRGFQQANSDQNSYMKDWLRASLQSSDRNGKVIELFCGSGNFTEVLRDLEFKKILSVEMDSLSVEELRKKNLCGVETQEGNLYQPAMWDKVFKSYLDAEILLLDPPREGFPLLPEFVEKFKKLQRIIYISCEPYEWARECRKLIHEYGWQVQTIQPLDQFPQTPHIELLSVLVRNTALPLS